MKNAEVAALLYDISELLELTGDNPFKIRAYSRAARAIENLNEDIELVSSQGRLDAIPGIGEGIAKKIGEYLRTGKVGFHEDLMKQVPKELSELLRVPGIGPKTVQQLHKELGIASIDALEKAAKEHRLRRLPRFGETREKNILKAIERYRARSARIPIHIALPIVQDIIAALRRSEHAIDVIEAGSLRRRKDTIGDIDILATSDAPEALVREFTHLPAVREVLGSGTTKATVIVSDAIQVDLRIVEARSFGTSLQYFTGSKEHNVKLREIAQKKGFKLSEYSLEEVSTGRQIYCRTEEEVYEKLGMQYIPPELREHSGEIEAAQSHSLPELVMLSDIRGDLHVHSDWSDGKNTIEEIARAASSMGYEYLGICDHSRSLGIANGLSEERLSDQIKEIHRLNEKLENFKVLAGIEVDIKADATLDLPDSILRECDVVVAAVHSAMRQDRRTLTVRIIKAMENQNVDIIAHPTGRIIGEREAYEADMNAVLDAALRTETALEINAYPSRLDLTDVYARKAKKLGVKIAINTDAHDTGQLKLMDFGVGVARRGWLESRDIFNTKSRNELKFKT